MDNIKKLPHSSGIYKITNILNGNSYIGQSKDIYERINSHHIYDYKNLNGPETNKQLYVAFRKYGLDNFKAEVLELCPPEALDAREEYWIQFYDTFKNGYNATPGGQNWSENIHSEETELKRQTTRQLNQSLIGENHPRAKLTNDEVLNIRKRYSTGETVNNIWEDYKDQYQSKEVFKRIIFGKSYTNVQTLDDEDIRYTNAKLNKQQVIDIRTKYYTKNASCSDLAAEYNMSQRSIKSICDRTSYSHIKDDIPNLRKRTTYRLSPDEVRAMRIENQEGATYASLAKKYNIGLSAVARCCRRETYSDID